MDSLPASLVGELKVIDDEAKTQKSIQEAEIANIKKEFAEKEKKSGQILNELLQQQEQISVKQKNETEIFENLLSRIKKERFGGLEHEVAFKKKNEEMMEMQISYRKKIDALEMQHKTINEQRLNELMEHSERFEKLREAHQAEIEELDKILLERRKAVLGRLKDKVEAETKHKCELRFNLLITQKTNLLTIMERGLREKALLVDEKVTAINENAKIVAELCGSVSPNNQEEGEVKPEVELIKACNLDWRNSTEAMKRELQNFMRMSNNRMGLDIAIRNGLTTKLNKMKNQAEVMAALRMRLEAIIFANNIKYGSLKDLGVEIEEEIKVMVELQAELAEDQPATDPTIDSIQGRILNQRLPPLVRQVQTPASVHNSSSRRGRLNFVEDSEPGEIATSSNGNNNSN